MTYGQSIVAKLIVTLLKIYLLTCTRNKKKWKGGAFRMLPSEWFPPQIWCTYHFLVIAWQLTANG